MFCKRLKILVNVLVRQLKKLSGFENSNKSDKNPVMKASENDFLKSVNSLHSIYF